MSCKICKRSSCTESFHSIEEQEEFENKTGIYAEEENSVKGNIEEITDTCENVDAMVFSSDALCNEQNMNLFKVYLGRWNRYIKENSKL